MIPTYQLVFLNDLTHTHLKAVKYHNILDPMDPQQGIKHQYDQMMLPKQGLRSVS